jgi:hypothetical protein
MEIDFYDASGNPVAYSQDGKDIYLFSGSPVAYIEGDAIYSFSGRHLGWFENGLIRDRWGNCVFFTDGATGGPVRPVRRSKPVKGAKHVKPVKGVKEVRPVKAVNSLSWSSLSGPAFFH